MIHTAREWLLSSFRLVEAAPTGAVWPLPRNGEQPDSSRRMGVTAEVSHPSRIWVTDMPIVTRYGG